MITYRVHGGKSFERLFLKPECEDVSPVMACGIVQRRCRVADGKLLARARYESNATGTHLERVCHRAVYRFTRSTVGEGKYLSKGPVFCLMGQLPRQALRNIVHVADSAEAVRGYDGFADAIQHGFQPVFLLPKIAVHLVFVQCHHDGRA